MSTVNSIGSVNYSFLGNSPASEFSLPTFRNSLSVPYFIHLPMKMEPIVSSETSAIRTQTPGNYPKRNNLHLEHGESLRISIGSVREFICNRRSFT